MSDHVLWALARPEVTHPNRVKWPLITASTSHNGHARASGYRCRVVVAARRDPVVEFLAVLATLFAVVAGVWL